MTAWLTDERVSARESLTAFGGAAMYFPPVGEPVTTVAMLDVEQIADGEYAAPSEPRLQLSLLAEDCGPEPATGATVVHDGGTYEIDGVDNSDGVVVRVFAREISRD